jgi:glutamine amidotransferase
MIFIVDYGVGNIKSIIKIFKRLNIEVRSTSNPDEVNRATKLVLPGVGHFAWGMQSLKELGLLEALHESVMIRRVPILGICLGMQLFSRKSEEGHEFGLGWIEAETRRLAIAPDSSRLRIPHMGWNSLEIRKSSPLLKNIGPDSLFYFAHSFHVVCADQDDILATTGYGTEFVSCLERENIYGIQFHPEKSHRDGVQLLRNYAELI